MTDTHAVAQLISRDLGSMSGEPFPPSHYAIRLAVLLADDQLRYLDTDRRLQKDRPWRAIAVGDKRLVQMDVEPSDSGSTVRVEAWSRSTLSRVELVPATEGDNARWGDVPDHGWPPGPALRLEFEGRAEPLVLPLSVDSYASRKDFGELLPSLLSDLG